MDEKWQKSFPVSWDQFHRDARALAWRLSAAGPFRAVVAVTRGGLVPAAIVARELGIRVIETVCVASYEYDKQGEIQVLKGIGEAVAGTEGGAGVLIVDDLVDTGATARVVREMLPKAHFATVYAKPAGRPLVDTFITEVSQDTWIYLPWDMRLHLRAADPRQGDGLNRGWRRSRLRGILLLLACSRSSMRWAMARCRRPRWSRKRASTARPAGLSMPASTAWEAFSSLFIFGMAVLPALLLAVAEAVVHYHIDFAKEIDGQAQRLDAGQACLLVGADGRPDDAPAHLSRHRLRRDPDCQLGTNRRADARHRPEGCHGRLRREAPEDPGHAGARGPGHAGRQHPHRAVHRTLSDPRREGRGRQPHRHRRPQLSRSPRRIFRRASTATRIRASSRPRRAALEKGLNFGGHHGGRGEARRGGDAALQPRSRALHQFRHRGQHDGAGRRALLHRAGRRSCPCRAAITAARSISATAPRR